MIMMNRGGELAMREVGWEEEERDGANSSHGIKPGPVEAHAAFNPVKFICQNSRLAFFPSSNSLTNLASGVVSILDLIVGSAPG